MCSAAVLATWPVEAASINGHTMHFVHLYRLALSFVDGVEGR